MSATPPYPPMSNNPPATPGSIPNYLVWSIIITVLSACLCCPGLITGIVAIVFSAQVNTKLNQGDIEGARKSSANAKIWCWVTTVLAIIGLFINIYVFMTGGAQQYLEMMEQAQHLQ